MTVLMMLIRPHFLKQVTPNSVASNVSQENLALVELVYVLLTLKEGAYSASRGIRFRNNKEWRSRIAIVFIEEVQKTLIQTYNIFTTNHFY